MASSPGRASSRAWKLDAAIVAVFRGGCDPQKYGMDYLRGGRNGPSLNSLAFCAATRRLFVVDNSSITVLELTAECETGVDDIAFALVATGVTLAAPGRINNVVVRDADHSLLACDENGVVSVWSTRNLDLPPTRLDNRCRQQPESDSNSTWGLAVPPAAADEDSSSLVVASSNHRNVVLHTTHSKGSVRSSAALGDSAPSFGSGVEVATHNHNIPAVAIGAGPGARSWLLASGGLDGVLRVCSFPRGRRGVATRVGIAAVAERSIAASDRASACRQLYEDDSNDLVKEEWVHDAALRRESLSNAIKDATRDFYAMIDRADTTSVQRAPLLSKDALRVWFSSRLAARGMRWPDYEAEAAAVVAVVETPEIDVRRPLPGAWLPGTVPPHLHIYLFTESR